MKKSKRILSIFLALLMLVMSVPLAFAEGESCQHTNMQHFDAYQSDFCGHTGNRDYWRCIDCQNYFADEAAKQPLTWDQIEVAPDHENHNFVSDIGFEENANQPWLSVDIWKDANSYCENGMSYRDYLASQGGGVTAKLCSYCGVVIMEDEGNGWVWTYHPGGYPYYLHEPGEVCTHESDGQSCLMHHSGATLALCGTTQIKEYWCCNKCGLAFADSDATQPVTASQLVLTSPYTGHNFEYQVGFEDEGNGHKWLGTTSYMEESYQEEFGMTVAQKFASEGYSAWNCTNCGVVVKDANGKEMRVGDLGDLSLFVNPIPELAGTVKLPTSPAGLAAGEKWMAYGNYYNAVYSLIPQGEDGLMMLVFTLAMLTMCDFYYNETTQELYMLSYDGDVQNFPVDMLRTVGDEESTKVIPTSSEGLAAGEKWFDAASFYQDAITNFVPDEDLARAEFEAFISSIAAAEFSLSADGSTVYAKGRKAEIAALLEEQGAPTDELAEIMNGGNWFLPLNTFLQSEIMEGNGISILNYVKTVEGGECAHVWNNGVKTKDPTCTQAGIMTYTCTNGCGATREEIIPALGHAWDGGVMNPQPTMTDTGVCTYTCTRCGSTKEITVPRTDPTSLLNDLKNKHNLRDNADDATVFFDDEANLPANTVFDYEIVEQSKFYQIFDLTLTSGGKEIEPEAPVWVKLPVPKGWNPNWITVWHGNEKLPSFAYGGYVYFLTTHFSEFQVKYDEQNQEENKPDNNDNENNTDTQPSGKVCKFCGEVHEGFFQKIIGFFHSILALFGLKKK